ncbi:sulfite exporter TauE/SafE family protein [Winogradskya humida]|uniref:Probable membrane transporter protein n=1 Tax=Winogradskya humida TaxID=113566 RepID=A0ABQ4A119_9ACTN|nr:sulfite exporter TauE/SafE family protein [Actinoplanes humidus]GIE24513.1 UPF0721 transmembrane protein [Actinoplanes humidus]
MLQALAILAAGFWAGMINVVVGSGTLVTFPVLLLFGYSPLVANVSNNIGLVGGGITGTLGYRSELAGRAATLKRLLPASALGGITGALLLLVLPAGAFQTIVPVLIVVGLVMVVWGPAIQRAARRRRAHVPAVATTADPLEAAGPGPHYRVAIVAGVYVLGIYGGYFGAAQGVLLVGLLSVLTTATLQSITGLKNLLTTVVNAVAAVTFMAVSWHSVNWTVVLLISVGSALGGVAGARVGRRLSPVLLRTIIVIVGLAALARLLFFA